MPSSFPSYFVPCKLGLNYTNRWLSQLGGRVWLTAESSILIKDSVLYSVHKTPREITSTTYWLNSMCQECYAHYLCPYDNPNMQIISTFFSGDKTDLNSLNIGVKGGWAVEANFLCNTHSCALTTRGLTWASFISSLNPTFFTCEMGITIPSSIHGYPSIYLLNYCC